MKTTKTFFIGISVLLLLFQSKITDAQFEPNTLPELQVGLTGTNYSVVFANGLQTSGAGNRCWRIDGNHTKLIDAVGSQFNEFGYPLYLASDVNFLMLPVETRGTQQSHITITWEGEADIRCSGNSYHRTYSPGQSTPETGLVLNGTREYDLANGGRGIEIHAIGNTEITSIKYMLSDPSNTSQSLSENTLFHPLYKSFQQDFPAEVMRFMDWGRTNQSKVKNWSERRKPDFLYQNGINSLRQGETNLFNYYSGTINGVKNFGSTPRRIEGIKIKANNTANCENNVVICEGSYDNTTYKTLRKITLKAADFDANKEAVYTFKNPATYKYYKFTIDQGNAADYNNIKWAQDNRIDAGVSYENMIRFCNETNKDMWINIPGMATNDYIRKLAQLINGEDPDGIGGPGLNSGLRVYVEFSNECWNGMFDIYIYAKEQALTAGISYQQWVARRFCTSWSIFADVLGQDRVVNVLAGGSGQAAYTEAVINEALSYGPTRSPAVNPHAVALATYFDANIAAYMFEKGYWRSDYGGDNREDIFIEWEQRLLSGADFNSGNDFTGGGAGFSDATAQVIKNAGLPIIGYEGITGIRHDSGFGLAVMESSPCTVVEGGTPGSISNRLHGMAELCEPGAGNQKFRDYVIAMRRDPKFADICYVSNSMAKAAGMRTMSQFGDIGGPGGEWGGFYVLENLADNNTFRLEYQQNWVEEQKNIKEIDSYVYSRPEFTSESNLPTAVVGQSYNAYIYFDGTAGDGTQLTAKMISKHIPEGLSVSIQNNNKRIRIYGTPTNANRTLVHFLFRVLDNHNDPVYGVFNLQIMDFGGGELLFESDFTGTAPAQNTPWTATNFLHEAITYNGWTTGNGTVGGADNNVFSFYGKNGQEWTDLNYALDNDKYISITFSPKSGNIDLRNAFLNFVLERKSIHSPKSYAVMTSIQGFAANKVLFTGKVDGTNSPTSITGYFPETSQYNNISGEVEIRIYYYEGIFFQKWTWMHSCMMAGKMIEPAPSEQFFIQNKATGKLLRPESASEAAYLKVVDPANNDNWVKWELVTSSDNYFYLKNVETGMYFRPVSEEDAALLEIRPTSYNGTRTQWIKVEKGDGYFHLKNRWTGKYFRPINGNENSRAEQRPTDYSGDWTRWRFVSSSSALKSSKMEQQPLAIQQDEASGILVYPNPCTGVFTIQPGSREISHIQVFNLQGQKVYETNNPDATQNIVAGTWSKGLYFIRMEANGKYETRKIIIE